MIGAMGDADHANAFGVVDPEPGEELLESCAPRSSSRELAIAMNTTLRTLLTGPTIPKMLGRTSDAIE
jgi:hypothetical protein